MGSAKKKTIGVCGVKVPFVKGGAEILSIELVKQLNQRGFQADLFEIPFGWWPPSTIMPNALLWRMLELTDTSGKPIDLMITTKFPAYLIKHPNKVAWLYHQMREVYDFNISEANLFDESLRDENIREKLIELDKIAFREHKSIFTISQNVSKRLKNYCDIESETIYPPPSLTGRLYNNNYSDYILSVGRLDEWKRTKLLVEALSITNAPVKAVIIGKGSEEKQLKDLAKEKGLENRIIFRDFVSDDELVDYYANAKAVFFCPKDEDYGFITVEAFLSGKPVITANDSGGSNEFVENNINGFIVNPNPEEISRAIDKLWAEPELPEKLGKAGQEKVSSFSWDSVIEKIVAPFI